MEDIVRSMFFSKPKVYKSDGESAAISLASKYSPQELLLNAEVYVERELANFGIFKSSNSQKKQICQLAIRFHEHKISYSNNKDMIPSLRDQILTDLL
tara:strand:+ start:824 stop:1117 length:294 start_codon:yes stop_codon:yes gene_type:complete